MPEVVFLTRVDREKNIQRWYRVELAPTLFAPVSVICTWGRLGSSYQRGRIISVETIEQGERLVARIVAKKLKRQYYRNEQEP